MAVSLDGIVKQLQDTGIVAAGTLANFLPPNAQPQSADELLRNLVEQHQLTKFQSAIVAQGKAHSLILGSYTILDKIGAGGMGQVYKAEHRRMKRIVAIKTLPAATMKDAAVVARFQREVEVAAKLNHANIVTAHDADGANGIHFLVMEYVEGHDLASLVKKHGPFSADQAVNYILQAARGLEFAHQKGVVHRDIKPANLLLDVNGTVKILDMGLARIEGTEHSPADHDLTGTGAVMGTVDYMAPEQWADTHTADGRTDLYALGCSLFYLLTGRAPYADDQHRSPIGKMKGHVQEAIPDLKAPDSVVEVYHKLMAKKPEDRFQTATALVAALTQIGSGASSNQRKKADVVAPAESVTAKIRSRSKPAMDVEQTVVPTSISSGSMEALIGTARKLYDAHDYPELIALLENVPAKSRTESVVTLLEDAKQKQAEFEILLLEVDDAKRRREPKELLTKAEQLLKLKPQHTPTRRLVKSLNSYGRKLDSAKFDVNNEPVRLPESDGILKGLGTYYIATVVTAVVAFGAGTMLVYSNLSRSNEKPANVAPSESPAEPSEPSQDFLANVGENSHSSNHNPVTTFQTSEFKQWMKDIAAMSAEKQIEAVVTKLKELNPEFDGKVWDHDWKGTPKIEKGVVTTFELATDSISDISPVRALTGLKRFACRGSDRGKSQLSDLSPLQGMSLTFLVCANTSVSDLSPLKDMKLTRLHCYGTPVTDLSPLQGMKLTDLVCKNTEISDLTPLRGMPLTTLSCRSTHVSELSPLKGVPLTELHISNTPVSDLSPLEGMNLTTFAFTAPNITKGLDVIRKMKSLKTIGLQIEGDQLTPDEFWKKFDAGGFNRKSINDPAFQQWMKDVQTMSAEKQVEAVAGKLKELNPGFNGKVETKIVKRVVLELTFKTNDVTDIAPVKALTNLRFLNCNGDYPNKGILSDLTPLQGMILTKLICNFTKVSDLSPIQGMPLSELQLGATRISDLSPLKGMHIVYLGFWGVPVSDLSPLKGMPLRHLTCSLSKVSDLSPLQGMTLQRLECHYTAVSDLTPLNQMTSLRLLKVFKTEVTAARVAELQKALPDCKIEMQEPKKTK